MPIQSMGSAPEILQAGLPKSDPQPETSETQREAKPVLESPPQRMQTTFVLPPPTSHGASVVDDGAPTPPEAEALEMLPDAEIDALVEKHIVKMDRRWSRATKIMKLLEAGIQKPADVPPPPPTVG